MRPTRLLPLLTRLLPALAASCLGDFCSPAGPPPEDSCSTPSNAGVATLEVGPDSDPFVPFTDGQMVTFLIGGQFASMLPVRLRVGGANPPACLGQRTTLTDDMGNEMARDKDPRATYTDGAFRTTHALYLVLFDDFAPPAHPLTLTVTVGSKAVTRTLYVAETPNALDGGASPRDGASTADAPPAPDAARIDAARIDAAPDGKSVDAATLDRGAGD